MAVIGTFNKQPGEILDYDIRYKEALSDGDYLTAVDATVSPEGAMTATASIVNNGTPSDDTDDTQAKVWCSDGVTGVKYKVTVVADTFLGRRIESEFYVKVKEL